MKTTLLIIIFSFIGFCSHAQKLKESEVPAAVKKEFQARFPKAKDVKWSKESVSEFEAEFEIGDNEQSANFDDKGKWLVTETEIKKSELPSNVQASIARDFPGYKIEEAEKAETSDSKSFYEVEIKKDKLEYELKISADGEILQKEEHKKENKKD